MDRARRWSPRLALVLLGALPLLALAIFAYTVSARAVERLVSANNDATATITSALVENEFNHWVNSLSSHAGFPTLAAAVATGEVTQVRRRLEVLVRSHPRLDRAFVTDTTGLLWSDYPRAPESLGMRFDDRDWFRGVTRTMRPYVSEVYERNAMPRLLLVAVAVPVHDPADGVVKGFLVCQVRLDSLTDLLRRVEVGRDGFVLLLDQSGAVVAHPHLDLQQRLYQEYAETAPVAAARRGSLARTEYVDPFSGQEMIASAAPASAGGSQWIVLAQQPLELAFAPTRLLAKQLAGAGLLLAVVVGALVARLARENARRKKAETALHEANEGLERRVLERTEELRDKEAQLVHAQKMEAVGRLAGGVAHDFNNLLTVVLGCCDLVLADQSDREAELQEVERIRDAGERAAGLTRQLLAFSRRQMMQLEVIDLNEILDSMRRLFERLIGEDIDLVLELSPELHPVKFDRSQIEQIVMNLVVNAHDAMPAGGKLTIETRNVDLDDDYADAHPDARTGPHAMLAVTDTGEGMDAATRARIFEPFFTTKKSGRGTGLGLSTAYGIVKQGGGNIWVYSEPGHGTTFKVYLPRTNERPETRRPSPKKLPRRGTETILLVEDEPGVRALLARVLTEDGYRVLEAGNAEEALAAVHEDGVRVDLLLTDVVLPGADGPEVAAELQRLHPELEVLYMSGYTDSAIVHRGLLEDSMAFIQKPIRFQDLREKVEEVLSGGS